jgi:type IV pilus assembly protein PilY1
MDDVALWGRTVDARPDLTGNQNIVLYPVFMFGQGSQLLKDAAINGGFNDLNGDNRPGPDLRETRRDSDEDGAITTNDLPLTYYEGDDGYALQASITQAIADILKRAASGTAVSVLTTSSRGVGSLVQAYFLPVRNEGLREVSWTGYAQNIWLDSSDNLREDTVNDYALKLADDQVMKMYFDSSQNETMAATFTTDAEGRSGSLASCSPAETKKFSDVVSIFESGKKLALRAPSTRNIFTANKVIHGTAAPRTIANNQFTVPNVITSATLSGALNPDATYTAENIVRYIRGECLETGVTGDTACGSNPNTLFRDRRLTVSGGSANGNVWKLGDIVNATPKVIGSSAINFYDQIYGDTTYMEYVGSDAYQRRTSVAVLSANDGMLHAVRLGYLKDDDDTTGNLASGVKALFKNLFSDSDGAHDQVGEEAWAYIPFNAFPYLKYLADPDYCHIYYSDLTTRLMDVSIGGSADLPTAARTRNSWRTILIGGMNFGGACSGGISPAGPPTGTPADVGFSSYFAIDVTDPENPVPMWEFSDPDMGYATTYPSVLRTGLRDQNGHWYVAVGSGSKQLPKTGVDIGRNSPGYVYILDLRTGTIVKKIELDHNAIVSDIISVDADWWYNVERLFFGTAYKTTSWQGKLMKIPIPEDRADLADAGNPWTPQVVTMFTGNYPFTASPDAAKDEDEVVWVFEGSGKYNSNLDEIDGSQQIFLAIKDDPDNITYPLTTADLNDRTNFQTTGIATGTRQECMFDPAATPPAFGMRTMVTSITPTSTPPPPSSIGWYLRLDTSPTAERVISRPLAVGGLVDFVSYKPNADPCAGGGDSYLYAVGYTTGVAPSSVAIVSPDVTGGQTTGTVNVAKRVILGPGSPPKGEAIILTPGKDLNKKIQTGKGVIVEIENESVYDVTAQIIHWLKK